MASLVLPHEQAMEVVQKKYQETIQSLADHGARIVVMGPTGVGKTSLLNAAFRKEYGKVGDEGVPCTQHVQMFEATAECPVHIYDTKGFEPMSEDGNKDIWQGLRELQTQRKEAAAQYPVDSPEHHKERLHAVWWVTHDRFDDKNEVVARIVNEIFGSKNPGVPIFVIVNKCDDKSKEQVDKIVAKIKSIAPFAQAVIPVVAKPNNGPPGKMCEACGSKDIRINVTRGSYTCSHDGCPRCDQNQKLKSCYGIDELLQKTMDCLPDLVAQSFLEAQADRMDDLDAMADRRIAFYASTAAAIGTVPIPGSDFPLLLANEVTMFIDLAKLYGVKVDPMAAKEVLGAASGVGLLAIAGYALGSGIKMIPGIGSMFGGATNAVIAASVTSAAGMLVKELLGRLPPEAVCREITAEQCKQLMSVEEQKAFFQQKVQETLSNMFRRR